MSKWWLPRIWATGAISFTMGYLAVVVDPQRDVDRIEKALAGLGVRCAMVLETHIHNDYVTGGYDLAQRTGCPYVVSAGDDVSFDRVAVRDGDELSVGSMRVRVMSTPGHTDTHLSYVISVGDGTPAVFTGGSMLYGSVGRTDLVDAARTDELTRSAVPARCAAWPTELPDATAVYPTHGFGSFCSSGGGACGSGGTIADEKHRNDALTTDDEDAFVEQPDRESHRISGVLRHMGAAQPRRPHRARPVAAGAAGRRPAACAHRCRGVGRRSARPHRVRRVARSRKRGNRDGKPVLHLRRLADAVGRHRCR